MVMVNVKGSAIVSTYNYIVKEHGETGWNKVLATLRKKEKNPLMRKLLVGSWYPFDTYVALLRALDDIYGKGDNRLIFNLGKFSAEDGLSTIYRFFFKVGSPNFIISRAAKIWSSYYSVGEMTIENNEKGMATIVLRDWPTPMKEHCDRVRGWITRAIEMSGGKDVKVKETKCQCTGDKVCQYDLRWK